MRPWRVLRLMRSLAYSPASTNSTQLARTASLSPAFTSNAFSHAFGTRFSRFAYSADGSMSPTSTFTQTPTVTATPTQAAAHIQLALFINQARQNGDGTLSSVISALVTDTNGAVVNDGIRIDFSLSSPVVAGVSE